MSIFINSKYNENTLAQKIFDEFLTCKICLEQFKCPKTLDCLHTFCEKCIESHVKNESSYKKYSDYRDFTCPLCRKHTQLSTGGVKKLQDNFIVSNLVEIVERRMPSKFPSCDICKSTRQTEASSKCLDCDKLMCRSCAVIHRATVVTQDHSLFNLAIEKEIQCKAHPEESVRFYCELCESCVCILCTFDEHKGHEISQLQEAVDRYKDLIQSLLLDCKRNVEVLDEQLDNLSKCDLLIKDCEQRIRDTAIEFIGEVRAREKQLIDELRKEYGDEVMSYVVRLKEMRENLESLKKTCSITELVLCSKDIEVLLLKKQVQEKLCHLSNATLTDLPNAVSKEMTFVPGVVHLGELRDLGSPSSKSGGSSKLVKTKSCNIERWETDDRREVSTSTERCFKTESTQTDDELIY